jgi:hypothetical protein
MQFVQSVTCQMFGGMAVRLAIEIGDDIEASLGEAERTVNDCLIVGPKDQKKVSDETI